MKRLIKWDSGEGKIVISKEEIMEVLFHRGRMLLLDQVTIIDGKVVGEFTVPAENCEGHEPIPNMSVMRGVDIPEMAFQLLAVFLSKNPKLFDVSKSRVCVAREITGVKFNGFIQPGDKIVLETMTEVHIDEIAGISFAESGKIIATVDSKRKCAITSVVLAGFDPTLIS